VTIVRTGGLGDTILVLPTFEILRAAYAGATLTLVGSAWAEALQPLVPFGARALQFDHAFPAAHRGGSEGGSGAGVLAASSAVILYTATPESDFVAHVQCACPGPVLVWPVAPAGGIHAARHLASAVAAVPSDPDALPTPTLRCPRELLFRSRWWLDRQFGQGVRPVAIHPGAGGRRKRWPVSQFAELATRLDAPVLLIEGPADTDACRAFVEAVALFVPVVHATGVSLPRLAALLVESRAYIGNDSGVSHLAAALGVPTVAVFGPTDPAVWAPLGPVVYAVAPRGDAPWPTVDDVLIAARRLSGDGPPGAGA
jgi:Glycosyltransferase family 9 (heptosyltransferase)